MGFLRPFLDKKALLYNITTNTSTSTGQPIETLVLYKTNVPVFFSSHGAKLYQFLAAGGVKVDAQTAILETPIQTNQVLEIEGVKWRINSADDIRWRQRYLAWVAHLEYFKH